MKQAKLAIDGESWLINATDGGSDQSEGRPCTRTRIRGLKSLDLIDRYVAAVILSLFLVS
jgi:hypothetical protein